jgi:hypothetical protein
MVTRLLASDLNPPHDTRHDTRLPVLTEVDGSMNLLTPKFGKESDLWVRLDEESVWWKEGSFQRYSAERSAVGYLLPFGKGTVELILRNWMVTWLKQEGRMDR